MLIVVMVALVAVAPLLLLLLVVAVVLVVLAGRWLDPIALALVVLMFVAALVIFYLSRK